MVDKNKQAPSSANQARTSLRRFSGRLAPRLQNLLDRRLEKVADMLDAWNQRLAVRALPDERRGRVEALAQSGKRARRNLRVVRNRSESAAKDSQGKKI